MMAMTLAKKNARAQSESSAGGSPEARSDIEEQATGTTTKTADSLLSLESEKGDTVISDALTSYTPAEAFTQQQQVASQSADRPDNRQAIEIADFDFHLMTEDVWGIPELESFVENTTNSAASAAATTIKTGKGNFRMPSMCATGQHPVAERQPELMADPYASASPSIRFLETPRDANNQLHAVSEAKSAMMYPSTDALNMPTMRMGAMKQLTHSINDPLQPTDSRPMLASESAGSANSTTFQPAYEASQLSNTVDPASYSALTNLFNDSYTMTADSAMIVSNQWAAETKIGHVRGGKLQHGCVCVI